MKSDSYLIATNAPVNKQRFGSVEKALPTKSSLVQKHHLKQNWKSQQQYSSVEVNSEEDIVTESGSGEFPPKESSNVMTSSLSSRLGSGVIFIIVNRRNFSYLMEYMLRIMLFQDRPVSTRGAFFHQGIWVNMGNCFKTH